MVALLLWMLVVQVQEMVHCWGSTGASACEASARAELEAAVSIMCGDGCISFGFAFSLSGGRDRGVRPYDLQDLQPLQRRSASLCVQGFPEPMEDFSSYTFSRNSRVPSKGTWTVPFQVKGHGMRHDDRCS